MDFPVSVSAWIQRTVVACLVLAVTLVLFQGLPLGYLCDCGDATRLVPVPECRQSECHPDHGHSDGCVAESDASDGCEDADPDHGQGHGHGHASVQTQPEWRFQEPDAPVPPPVATSPVPASSVLLVGPSGDPACGRVPVLAQGLPLPRRSFLTPLLRI